VIHIFNSYDYRFIVIFDFKFVNFFDTTAFVFDSLPVAASVKTAPTGNASSIVAVPAKKSQASPSYTIYFEPSITEPP
jgi:hypothetical protein